MERKEDGISDDVVDLFDKWSGTFEEHGLSWEEYRDRHVKTMLSNILGQPKDPENIHLNPSPIDINSLSVDMNHIQNR